MSEGKFVYVIITLVFVLCASIYGLVVNDNEKTDGAIGLIIAGLVLLIFACILC